MNRLPCFLGALLLVAASALPAWPAADAAKPRVRAITAFITIDAANYRAQIEEAAAFLANVRAAVKAAGYDVQTIRVSTQPFPEYTQGLDRAAALALLHDIGEVSRRLGLFPTSGRRWCGHRRPPQSISRSTCSPSRATASTPISSSQTRQASTGTPSRQAARVIRLVGERSPHGQGNFNFGAIAMMKPYGPFYPGAWHPGGGPRSFAIGLESANVVMDVFAREHDPGAAKAVLTEALDHARPRGRRRCHQGRGRFGWTYAGIDPTPAPGGQSSIGAAIESFTGAPFGRQEPRLRPASSRAP